VAHGHYTNPKPSTLKVETAAADQTDYLRLLETVERFSSLPGGDPRPFA
jgi:hypothetical protein